MRRSFYWDRLVIKIICLLELGGGGWGGLCVTLDLNTMNRLGDIRFSISCRKVFLNHTHTKLLILFICGMYVRTKFTGNEAL